MKKNMGQVRTWRAEEKDIFNCEQGKKFKGRQLVLEDTYHSIDNQALKNNVKIKSVRLADSVKEIGNQSFYNCTALRDINLENVSQIRWESFLGCVHLKEITLSSGIRYLGRRSFSGCKRLNCVKFQESTMLKGIEAGVFQNCESIEKISLPKGLTEIGNKAFYKCTSLKDIELPEGIRIIGNEAFYQTAIQEIKLPSTLVEIGNSAFLKCRSLEFIQIPASVKKIGRWSFHGCGQLKKVEFLGEPEEIGEWIINKSTVIRCKKGSRIEAYCKEKEFQIEYNDAKEV